MENENNNLNSENNLDSEWIHLILKAKKMGMTVEEIRNYIRTASSLLTKTSSADHSNQ